MSVRVALAALALAWFAVLWVRPLYKADESRYAEISREMAVSGDWITPRLNGFKYFEKPPLQYWTTAAAFQVLGTQDWTARLWTALTGFAGILLVVAAGNRLFAPPAGVFAAAVLAASPLYVLLGQYNTLDMGLTFFMSAAIFAFALGHVLLFWAACALAVLSKGLIGIVLPLATIAIYALARRDFEVIKRMRIVPGGLLFLFITAPWFIAVSLANDEFARFFFIHEHFERFTTQVHQRGQPVWYFVPVLALGMGPLLLPVLWGWIRSRSGPQALLAIWALVVLLFFSASGSKLPSYILPAFPALAVLAGGWLAAANARPVLLAQSALGVAAAAGIVLWASRTADYGPWITASGVCLGSAALVAAALVARARASAALAAVALGAFAATQLAIAGHATQASRFSVASTVAAMPAPPGPNARVFAVHAYDHTMPWLMRRTVTMVGGKDELESSIAWEPGKFLPDLAAFARAWLSAPEAYAFLDASQFDTRRAEFGVPMQLVARGPRYVLVKKP